MSRKKLVLTDDDYIDYDNFDFDEYDDEGYGYSQAKSKPAAKPTKPEKAKPAAKATPKSAGSGVGTTSGISVKVSSPAVSGGIKLVQPAGAKSVNSSTVSTSASMPAKKETHTIVMSNKDFAAAHSTVSAAKSDDANDPDDKLAYSAEKLSIRLREQEREEMQRVQDLDFMGFGEEAAKVEVIRGSVWRISRQEAEILAARQLSLLLTDNAPLSDDEYDEGVSAPASDVISAHAGANAEKQGGGAGSKGDAGRCHITMVVAGHVDAGKSTLVGHLLWKTGKVQQRTVQKYQKESAQQGKGSFALAWVMDDTAAEREHGVTIDIAERQITTAGKVVTILDAPGHRDFIPNMISGATFADAALLVVPASVGEYESSMGERAQTREHAVLLKALGVVQILVVVNKMDMTSPSWSESRFESIKFTISEMLSQLQFSIEKNVRFIPVAGLSGENISDISAGNAALRSWYTGPTLLDSIEAFRNPVRHVNRPLRAIVSAVVSARDKKCTVRANVLQGRLRSGRGVSLTSANGAATISSIMTDDGVSISELVAGQSGTVILVDRSGRSAQEMDLTNGMVLCKGPPLAPLTWRFLANIFTMAGIETPIMPGSVFDLFVHGEELQCKVSQIVSMRVPTGEGGVVTKRSPKCIPGSRSAVVVIETLERKVCVETQKDCKGLGRFALRARGATVAVGVCEEVLLS